MEDGFTLKLAIRRRGGVECRKIAGMLSLVSLLCIASSAASAEERQLYTDLFIGPDRDSPTYIPDVRPRLNSSQTVLVKVDLDVNQIKELDEKSQTLHTVGFLRAEWIDDYLQWDPAKYAGIQEIVIPPNKVWLPDFGILNSAETFYQDDFYDHFHVHVSYSGRVVWSFGGLFATTCEIETTLFPFDLQHCHIVVENWAYNVRAVELINGSDGVLLDGYHENGVWQLVGHAVTVNVTTYETDPDEQYPQVKFTLHLERKPRYYLVNILVPCIFITSIALLVFWLPPAAGEKVSLGVTVLLAFSVFQLVIADSTPKNSDYTPLLSIFVTLTMALSTISVVTTVLVLYLYHMEPNYRVPGWARILAFEVVARMLCMNAGGRRRRRKNAKQEDGKQRHPQNSTPAKLNRFRKPDEEEAVEMKLKPATNDEYSGTDVGGRPSPLLQSLRVQVEEVVSELKTMSSRFHVRAEEKDVSDEWQALAKIVDRLLFTIVSLILIGALAWLFYMSMAFQFNEHDSIIAN